LLCITGSKHVQNMGKVAIKILQGSVITQTVLDGLSVYPPVAGFLLCRPVYPKHYESWLGRQSYCNNKQAYFLAHPVAV